MIIESTPTGVPVDWNDNDLPINTHVPVDINQGVTTDPQCNMTSPGQILNGFDDWNSLKYRKPASGGESSGSSIEIQSTLPDRSIESVIQDRIILLEGIHEAINRLPNNAFALPTKAEGIRETLSNLTQPNTGNISAFLLSNQLDAAIGELSKLRSKADSSFGGSQADDLISSLPDQKESSPHILHISTHGIFCRDNI